MKIGMILAYENSPYAGVVRPFINWGKFFNREKLAEVNFLLLKVGERVIKTLRDEELEFTIFKSISQLASFIRNEAFDFVLIDDYITRLKILERVRCPTKKAVYTQVLYGMHSIASVYSPIGNKERFFFSIVKLIPFSFFKKRYSKLIKKNADVVIANSQITATLLSILYGIEPNGVVYPPVDTKIFKPQNVEKKKQVLLYLGSHAGDTDENLARRICKILENMNFEILVIGNKILAEKLSKEFKIHLVSGVSDKELAKIYSKCKLTICPQKWEQFGYVVAESIVCGTPVLAFNRMGPAEIIRHTKFGILANNGREFIKILENVDKYLKDLNFNRETDFPFASEISTKKLIEITEKYENT